MPNWIEQSTVIEYATHYEITPEDCTHRVRVTSAPAVIIQDRFSEFLHNSEGAYLVLNEEMEVEGCMDSWYELWFADPQDAVQFRLMQ